MYPFCRNIYQQYSTLVKEKIILDDEFKSSPTPDTKYFLNKYKEIKKKSFEFLSNLYFEYSRGVSEKLIGQIDNPLERKTTLNSIIKIASLHLTPDQLKGYLQMNFPTDKETIDSYHYFLVAHLTGREEEAKSSLEGMLLSKGELQPDHQFDQLDEWDKLTILFLYNQDPDYIDPDKKIDYEIFSGSIRKSLHLDSIIQDLKKPKLYKEKLKNYLSSILKINQDEQHPFPLEIDKEAIKNQLEFLNDKILSAENNEKQYISIFKNLLIILAKRYPDFLDDEAIQESMTDFMEKLFIIYSDDKFTKEKMFLENLADFYCLAGQNTIQIVIDKVKEEIKQEGFLAENPILDFIVAYLYYLKGDFKQAKKNYIEGTYDSPARNAFFKDEPKRLSEIAVEISKMPNHLDIGGIVSSIELSGYYQRKINELKNE